MRDSRDIGWRASSAYLSMEGSRVGHRSSRAGRMNSGQWMRWALRTPRERPRRLEKTATPGHRKVPKPASTLAGVPFSAMPLGIRQMLPVQALAPQECRPLIFPACPVLLLPSCLQANSPSFARVQQNNGNKHEYGRDARDEREFGGDIRFWPKGLDRPHLLGGDCVQFQSRQQQKTDNRQARAPGVRSQFYGVVKQQIGPRIEDSDPARAGENRAGEEEDHEKARKRRMKARPSTRMASEFL